MTTVGKSPFVAINKNYMQNKYRLGNKDKEYELIATYLGWLPEGYADWHDWVQANYFNKEPNFEFIIVSPNKEEKVTLIMDHLVTKDAFPLSFLREERAKEWFRFCIVSLLEEPIDQFIIPLL